MSELQKELEETSVDVAAFDQNAKTSDYVLSPDILEKMEHLLGDDLDERWYIESYARDIDQLKRPDESIRMFYLRIGGRLGHDPNPDFSELAYRINNRQIWVYLRRAPTAIGFLVSKCLKARNDERFLATSVSQSTNWRALVTNLDRKFIEEKYPDSANAISPYDFYILNSKTRPILPNADFPEAEFREKNLEIARLIKDGLAISAYHHFITMLKPALGSAWNPMLVYQNFIKPTTRTINHNSKASSTVVNVLNAKSEKSELTPLEENIMGLTSPVEFGFLSAIEELKRDIPIRYTKGKTSNILVLVPYYFPDIMFGGYIAFFDIIRRLKKFSGVKVELLVARPTAIKGYFSSNVKKMQIEHPLIAEIFDETHYLPDTPHLSLKGNWNVISYCAETHYYASSIAKKLGRLPAFVIQDWEADFHGAGSLRTFTRDAFLLPHLGIYNSAALREWVKSSSNLATLSADNYDCVSFENATRPLTLGYEAFRRERMHKLTSNFILYGRPESHASRNEFATAVLALRQAISSGAFSRRPWRFISIGTMNTTAVLPLGGGYDLEVRARMSRSDYEQLIQTADVGMSIISTPHPGIAHFQLARYGAVTVTNTFGPRTKDWLNGKCGNLIGCDLSVEGLANGLATAVERVVDLKARHRNAVEANLGAEGEDGVDLAVSWLAEKFGLTILTGKASRGNGPARRKPNAAAAVGERPKAVLPKAAVAKPKAKPKAKQAKHAKKTKATQATKQRA